MCLFRHDDSENDDIIANELTATEWIDMARQVACAGTLNLLITGGEPMLRSDFCEIWEGIYKQGFLITLYTNATLITPKIMETLRKYPPHKIGVTIYGATPYTYNKVCGNANAFERAMDGISQLMTLPSIMEFRTTIIKDNYPEVLAIEELVHKRFGEQYKMIQTRLVTKSVRGACADVESCRLEPEDNVKLAYLRGLDSIKKEVGESYDERNISIELVENDDDKVYSPTISLFGCDAGMNSYTISWDGRLLGCQMLGIFSVDVRENGFLSAWEKYPSVVKLPPINTKCKNCEHVALCNSCYASRYAETGDFGGWPEYVCKDTEIISRIFENGGMLE